MMLALALLLAVSWLPEQSLQKRIDVSSRVYARNPRTVDVDDSPSSSDKVWDWKGVVSTFTVRFPSGHTHRLENVFLALPGRTHSSACKLAVHGNWAWRMTQPKKQTKGLMVGQVKGLIMMLCTAYAQLHEADPTFTPTESGETSIFQDRDAFQKCRELGFGSTASVSDALHATGGQAMHFITDAQKDTLTKLLTAGGSDPDSIRSRARRLRGKIQESAQVYRCLVKNRWMEAYNEQDLANETGFGAGLSRFGHSLARGFISTRMRLANKLASEDTDRDARATLYGEFLDTVFTSQKLKKRHCEDLMKKQGIVALKGIPSSRVGSIDLMSILGRQVEVSKSGRAVSLSIADKLQHPDEDPTVVDILESRQNLAEGDSFGDLLAELSKHVQRCEVQKVGVFNVKFKSRLKNKFTWTEKNPWKVVLFSEMAVGIMSQNAHGQEGHEGHDLFGDPQEIEQPCKWKARALEEGRYKPISQWLQVAKDVGEVLSGGENLTFMNVRNQDRNSFLWMDHNDKIVMPDWARATQALFDCKVFRCDGRNFPHYADHFADDVRGLIDAGKSLEVFRTLFRRGWKMDPPLNWRVKKEGGNDWRTMGQQTIIDDWSDMDGISNLLLKKSAEPLQLSPSLVSAIYPFDEMTASISFLRAGKLLSTEASSVWSVYDYLEGYRDHCFVFDSGSISDGNDRERFAEAHSGNAVSRWFLDTPFGSTIHFCTNSFSGSYKSKSRTVVTAGGTVNRDDVVRELITMMSTHHQVSDHQVASCQSSADSLFNTCFSPSACVENPRNPCPNGYACDCDVGNRATAMNVGMFFSVILEGTVYMQQMQNIFGPMCVSAATAMLPVLIPACPFIAGALGYIQAPFGSNTPIVIAGISVFMGMSSCGCVPMTCGSGAILPMGNSNRVCALSHPSGAESLNDFSFVPPPGTKCVQRSSTKVFDKCVYKSCAHDEMLAKKVEWDQRVSTRRITEIFNCQSPDVNVTTEEYKEDLRQRFNEAAYIEKRKDQKELREGLVPRPREEVKLSSLLSTTFWVRVAGAAGKEIRQCFWSFKTRKNLKVTRHSWVGQLAKFPFKLLMSPLCILKFALKASLSVAFFILDYVMGAVVQALVSTLRLLEKAHVNLQRLGRWWQFCTVTGEKVDQIEDAPSNTSDPETISESDCARHSDELCLDDGEEIVDSETCARQDCCWDGQKCHQQSDEDDDEELETLMEENGNEVEALFNEIKRLLEQQEASSLPNKDEWYGRGGGGTDPETDTDAESTGYNANESSSDEELDLVGVSRTIASTHDS